MKREGIFKRYELLYGDSFGGSWLCRIHRSCPIGTKANEVPKCPFCKRKGKKK